MSLSIPIVTAKYYRWLSESKNVKVGLYSHYSYIFIRTHSIQKLSDKTFSRPVIILVALIELAQ